MAQNLTQHSPYDDEIDLLEIFKILIESKKLIISSILIFTIASIIYSLSSKPLFLTSTKLEIGYYVMPDGNQKLIEKPSNLISDLKVLIMKNSNNKFNQQMSINSFEGKVINLETTSNSVEQNEDFLNEVISYIYGRHSKLSSLNTDQKKDQISNEIETIESEVSFIKAKQLNSNQLKKSKIEDRISKLKSDLPIIDLEISQFEKVIIEDTNNLSLLKRNEEMQRERASSSPTLEQIIFSYKSEINDLNAKKFANILETKSLNNQLTTLENINLQSDELFSLEQERKILENQLVILTNQNTIQSSPIADIETSTIKPKNQLIIFLGIIIGLITGILLVFIRNFIKSFRESEA